MTNVITNTKALDILANTNLPCLDLIAKDINAFDLVQLLLTSRQLGSEVPLIIRTVRSLSPEQQRKFFLHLHGQNSFASKIEESIMAHKVDVERLKGITWLASCARPTERQRLMKEAFDLLGKYDSSQKRDMLHYLTTHLMPDEEGETKHPDEATLFNDHLRPYLECSKELDSFPMLEYWLSFTDALDDTQLVQKAKNKREFVNFVASKKITGQAEQRLSEMHSRAIFLLASNENDTLEESLLENLLDSLRSHLKKYEETPKIKALTLYFLTISIESIGPGKINKDLFKKFQDTIESLSFEIEKVLHPEARWQILYYLLSFATTKEREEIYIKWALEKIEFFSQKEIAIKDMNAALITFTSAIISLSITNIEKKYGFYILYLLERWAENPVLNEYDKNNIVGSLKELQKKDNLAYLHAKLEETAQKIDASPTISEDINPASMVMIA